MRTPELNTTAVRGRLARLVRLSNFWGLGLYSPPMKEEPIRVKKSALTMEKAVFVQEQCERALRRTIDDREAIQRKGTFMLGVITAVLAFGVGWVTDSWNELSGLAKRVVITESVLLCLLSVPLVLCYLPSLYAGEGYDLKKLLKSDFFGQSVEKIRIGYAYRLQDRIEFNKKRNDTAAHNLKSIASLLIFSPLLALFITFLIGCFWTAS